jgi:hypothetical protein
MQLAAGPMRPVTNAIPTASYPRLGLAAPSPSTTGSFDPVMYPGGSPIGTGPIGTPSNPGPAPTLQPMPGRATLAPQPVGVIGPMPNLPSRAPGWLNPRYIWGRRGVAWGRRWL